MEVQNFLASSMLLKKMTLQRGAVEAFNTRCIELRNTSLVLHWSGIFCMDLLIVFFLISLPLSHFISGLGRCTLAKLAKWLDNYVCSAKASISVPDRRDLPQGCTSFCLDSVQDFLGLKWKCLDSVGSAILSRNRWFYKTTSQHKRPPRLRSVFTESQEPPGFCTCRPVEICGDASQALAQHAIRCHAVAVAEQP